MGFINSYERNDPMAYLINVPEHESMSMTFPDFDQQNEEKDYDTYVNKCIETMDKFVESRTVDTATAANFMIDTEEEIDPDGLIAYNPNSHQNEDLSNKFTHQKPEAKSTSYLKHVQEETQKAANEAWEDARIKSGYALKSVTDSFGGIDKMNMSMDQVLNAIAMSNAKSKLYASAASGAKSINGFSIVDGRYVRQFSPNFTICPEGNPYGPAFAYWSNWPMTPQYNEIKEKYAEEELKAVQRSKQFYILCGKPEGMSDEDWEIELDIKCNPYTKYGAPVPTMEQPKPKEDILDKESRFSCSVSLVTYDEDGTEHEYEKVIDETFTNDPLDIQQRCMLKEKIDLIKLNSVRYAPGNLYRQLLIDKQNAMDKVCPGWDTTTAEEFFDPNSTKSGEYWRKVFMEPKQKLEAARQRYAERYGTPTVLPMEAYLKNVGLQRLNDIASNNTEGDLMIQKMNLEPGTPGFEMAMKKKADEIKWCQENINPDGSYNLERLKEKYPNWEAMRKAHKLSIMYTDHKSTIADKGSIMKLPLSIESSLTTEEKQACGILPEAPDYNAMKAYADSKGQTILEAFDLRESPFKNRFNADGTLKPGGFGQPGFERKSSCKYKSIKECPDYFLTKEEIPEQFINDFAWSAQDKRWINLDRI